MKLIATIPPLALAAIAIAAPAADSVIDPAQTFGDNCSACHQSDGKGIEGAFPALAGDKFVVGPPEEPIRTVLNGRGGMPTFRNDLNDAQIAAALTYVRSSWGNKASPVTAAQVASRRGTAANSPNSGH